MKLSCKVHRFCPYCSGLGIGLMSLALLLHPMSPDDFLALALSAPLATIQKPYGMQAATLFWISVPTICMGALGLVCDVRFLCKRIWSGIGMTPHALRLDAEDTEENWTFL
jgi:hypothetical protein